MIIYIIIRKDFDNMENREPYLNKILGYTKSVHEACKLITLFVETDEKEKANYKGYNDEVYPKYSFQEVSYLKPECLNITNWRKRK